MPTYRFYSLKKDGHIAGTPSDFDCPDDNDAVKEAEKLLDGRDIEIWQGTRVVAYISHRLKDALTFAARAVSRPPISPKH
jgi:hypothetical protein